LNTIEYLKTEAAIPLFSFIKLNFWHKLNPPVHNKTKAKIYHHSYSN